MSIRKAAEALLKSLQDLPYRIQERRDLQAALDADGKCQTCGTLPCCDGVTYTGWREWGDDGYNGIAWCGRCGRVLQVVRPGKWQCELCECD